ncbi:MAG: glycosyltransferase family 8 protein [Clostridiaceae bacterium]|nr:glycosyltransferase family 8 protein [Clostridiaceae bacterium]
MNILVTLNSNYLNPLKVMLKSLFLNNPKENFNIYIMQSSLTDEELQQIEDVVNNEVHKLYVISIKDEYFKDAPVVMHYSKEMYYRLLAFKFMPPEVDKLLYLDPDILIINNIKELYNTDLTGYLFAAAYHDRGSVNKINKIRLKPYDIEAYYNSGVLLFNLNHQRKIINENDIFDFVRENANSLILPDQDILNALYSKSIKQVDEILYNYDPRYYNYYKILSNGKYDMNYIIYNTAIIHFCGKQKPWKKNYSGKFHSLYKHYERIALAQS